MSRYGYESGPDKIQRNLTPNYEDPETVRNNARFKKALLESNQERRFRDGPVFTQRDLKRGFFQKDKGRWMTLGFFGTGLIWYFCLNPVYQLFVRPFFSNQQTPLNRLKPETALNKAIEESYNHEHKKYW